MPDYSKLTNAALIAKYRAAVDRQTRAETNEAWLQDQMVIDAAAAELNARDIFGLTESELAADYARTLTGGEC